jgi:hypothetical protein
MYNYFQTCVGIPLSNFQEENPIIEQLHEFIEEWDIQNTEGVIEAYKENDNSDLDPLVQELIEFVIGNSDVLKFESSYSGASDQTPVWISYIPVSEVELPEPNAFSFAFSSQKLNASAVAVKEFEEFCAQKMSTELFCALHPYIGLAFNAVTS